MKLSRRIARLKIYFDRSRMYFSYITFIMVFVIFIRDMKISFIKNHFILVLIISIPVIIAGFLFFGWLDDRLGIRKRETEINTEINPVVMEILNRLKSLEKKLK